MINKYLKQYLVAVDHPYVSGFEHLDMLMTRDRLAVMESSLNKREKEKLSQVDGRLLAQANVFYMELAKITNLAEERERRRPLPDHWWWYLDVIVTMPTNTAAAVAAYSF